MRRRKGHGLLEGQNKKIVLDEGMQWKLPVERREHGPGGKTDF